MSVSLVYCLMALKFGVIGVPPLNLGSPRCSLSIHSFSRSNGMNGQAFILYFMGSYILVSELSAVLDKIEDKSCVSVYEDCKLRILYR